MYYDLPPTGLGDMVIEIAHQIEQLTHLPRQAVLDVCPVCSRAIIIRHGHAMCVSGICRGRILEGCCGE